MVEVADCTQGLDRVPQDHLAAFDVRDRHRPIIALVEAGALAIDIAVGTVDLISANNPYITRPIVAEFRRLAGDADRRRLGEG
jgi:hypothetical protein